MSQPVVVVGGGVAGSSVAAHLAERGDRPVVLFEPEGSPAAGATAVSPGTWRRGPPGEAGPLDRMRRYGMGYYNGLLADHPARFDLLGGLTVSTTEDGAADLRALATADTATRGAEFLSPQTLRRTVPCPDLTTALTGALYRPFLGCFDAGALAEAMAARATEAGATVEHAAVTELRTDGDRVTGVLADGEAVPAAAVVLAAGAGTARLARRAGVDLPVRYTAGYAATLEPPRPLSARLPMLDHHESPVSFRGADDGRAVAHRAGPTANAEEYYAAGVADPRELPTDGVPGDVLSSFRTVADRLVAPLAGGELVDSAAAPLSRTPDGRPVAGWTSVPGLSVVTRHGTGVQFAPALGDVVARQLLDGEPTPLHDAVTPARFGGSEARFAVGQR